jgi:hypothetical protein
MKVQMQVIEVVEDHQLEEEEVGEEKRKTCSMVRTLNVMFEL